MEPGRVYSTTFVHDTGDGLVAIEAISLPVVDVKRRKHFASLERVLTDLGLRVAYEIPPTRVTDAMAAILASKHVAAAVGWLQELPEPVALVAPSPLLREVGVSRYLLEAPRDVVAERRVKSGKASPPIPRTPGGSPESYRLRAFTEEVAREQAIPFRESPLDLHSLQQLVQAAHDGGVWLVTAGTRPLVLVKATTGYILFKAVKGVGRGIEGALAAGVQYRLLRLFGIEDGDADQNDGPDDPAQ